MSITNLLIAAKVAFTDLVLNDGDVAPLTINDGGRLRVSSKQGSYPANVGNLVSIGDQLAVEVSDASNIMMHIKNTGSVTLAAGIFAFEASLDSTDGVNGTWFGIQAVRSNASTVETANPTLSLVAGAGNTYAWEASVNGMKWVRIRCTTAVTASSIATWTVQRGSYATEPAPAMQTHAVTGSGNFTTTPATATVYALTSAATTNAALIKSTAGTIAEISVFNPTAAAVYVRLYNKTTAPTVGTDIPLVVIPVPVNGVVALEFGTLGKRFSSGIAIAITAGAPNTDAVAVAAGVLVSASYI